MIPMHERLIAWLASSDWFRTCRLGAMIDRFDVVLRVNAAMVNGFQKDVGSFTTIRYTNL